MMKNEVTNEEIKNQEQLLYEADGELINAFVSKMYPDDIYALLQEYVNKSKKIHPSVINSQKVGWRILSLIDLEECREISEGINECLEKKPHLRGKILNIGLLKPYKIRDYLPNKKDKESKNIKRQNIFERCSLHISHRRVKQGRLFK